MWTFTETYIGLEFYLNSKTTLCHVDWNLNALAVGSDRIISRLMILVFTGGDIGSFLNHAGDVTCYRTLLRHRRQTCQVL